VLRPCARTPPPRLDAGHAERQHGPPGRRHPAGDGFGRADVPEAGRPRRTELARGRDWTRQAACPVSGRCCRRTRGCGRSATRRTVWRCAGWRRRSGHGSAACPPCG
jgi:hypothetical protein